ncbi:MAG: hypothetical protein H6670_04560 [Anaerolineaceae bacterium]|nr:hypothetical protein [Anaerolineaceae bacterium]
MKKHICNLLVLTIYALLQQVPSSAQLTPTPVIFPPPRFGGPELICPYFRDVENGSTWEEITIGLSSQSDLENYLAQFGRYEIAFPNEGSLSNSIGYRWRESTAKSVELQAPRRIDICLQDGVITVIDVDILQRPEYFYIDDLVDDIGAPDIVTWGWTDKSRLVFWFMHGIVADVFTQYGDEASFGLISRMIYFPPQGREGYERRWPFNLTRMTPYYPVDPSIPSEQNPFSFDIATE